MSATSDVTAQQLTFPVYNDNLTTFIQDVETCYARIHAAAVDAVEDNNTRQQKYFELKELCERIRKAPYISSHPLTDRIQRIQEDMHRLRQDYQTNSHWLVLTLRQSHFAETTPDISKRPDFKFDPMKLQESLENVKLLPRGIEKVRALQVILNTVCESQSDQISELIEMIYQFSDQHFSLYEKILALKQIEDRDGNTEQSRELNALIDRTGSGYVSHFLQNIKNLPMLIQYLTVVVIDRSNASGCSSPIELMRDWPIKTLNQRTARRWIKTLAALERTAQIQDPYVNIVVKYLQNLADPTGRLRCERIVERTKSPIDQANQISLVVDTLEQFSLPSNRLTQDFALVHKVRATLNGSTFDILIHEMKRRKLTSKELGFVATKLKGVIARDWLSFDMQAFLEKPSRFKDLIGDRDAVCQSITRRLIDELKSIEDRDHKAAMLHNLLKLSFHLMVKGEVGLSFTLYSAGVDNTRRSCAESWRRIRKSCQKHEAFMQQIIDISANCRNLRDFLNSIDSKKIIRIPYFPIDLKDIVQFEEQRSQLTSNRMEQLFHDFKAPMEQLVEKLAPDAEDLLEWGQSHLLDDPNIAVSTINNLNFPTAVKRELKHQYNLLVAEVHEINMRIESRTRILNRQFAALKIFYFKHPIDGASTQFYH